MNQPDPTQLATESTEGLISEFRNTTDPLQSTDTQTKKSGDGGGSVSSVTSVAN